MIDSIFVDTLALLATKGSDGVDEMRQVLKENGGMNRLIAIAQSKTGKPKKGQLGLLEQKVLTRISDAFPPDPEKAKAIAYWQSKRRPDLVARIEDIAEQFHAHYLSNGERSENWPMKFKTWYIQAIEFNRPPRGDLFVASVNPIQQQRISVAEWVARLETFYGDTDMAVGTWNLTWGGKPPTLAEDIVPANCACPTQAFALYLDRKKRRA